MNKRKHLLFLASFLFAAMLLFQLALPVQAADAKKIPKMKAVDVKGSVYKVAYYKDDPNQPILLSTYQGDHYVTFLDKNGKTIRSYNASESMREYSRNYSHDEASSNPLKAEDVDIKNIDNIFDVDISYSSEHSEERIFYAAITPTNKVLNYLVSIDDTGISSGLSPIYYGAISGALPIAACEKAVKDEYVSIISCDPPEGGYGSSVVGKPIKTNIKYNSKYEVATISGYRTTNDDNSLVILSLYNTKKKTSRIFYSTKKPFKTFKKIKNVQDKKAEFLNLDYLGGVASMQTKKNFSFIYYNQKPNKAYSKKTIAISNTKTACIKNITLGAVVCTGKKNYLVPYLASGSYFALNKVEEIPVSYKAKNITNSATLTWGDPSSTCYSCHLLADKSGYIRAYGDFKKCTTFKCKKIKNKKYTSFIGDPSYQLVTTDSFKEGYSRSGDDPEFSRNYSYLYISTGNNDDDSDAQTYRIPADSFLKKIN